MDAEDAFGFVLVASIRRMPLFQVAVVIRTVSVDGGAVAGVTVSVPVRVAPKAVAVTVTTVSTVTAVVVTGNAPVDTPPLTTTLAGTLTTTGLLLVRATTAPMGTHIAGLQTACADQGIIVNLNN